jgi:hypothetical protein
MARQVSSVILYTVRALISITFSPATSRKRILEYSVEGKFKQKGNFYRPTGWGQYARYWISTGVIRWISWSPVMSKDFR